MKGVTMAAYLLLFLTMTQQSCAGGLRLTTEGTDPVSISGTYTLMLYGCKYPDDIENVALLVDENSAYTFDIFDIPSMYTMKKGLHAQQALAEANRFTRCSFHTVVETRVRRILDNRGATIGYDMRPIYIPYDVGVPDAMLITYTLKDGKVTAYIRLTPELKMRDRGGDSPDRDHDGGVN